MNGKLIFGLSMFGLAMGLGTVFFIPSNIEPIVWLVVFLICGYIIAKRAPERYFLHGLLLGLLNSVWVTGAHILFFDRYLANHTREAAMMSANQLPIAPKVFMLCVGPVVGLLSGLILGLFAVVTRKLVTPATGTSTDMAAKSSG